MIEAARQRVASAVNAELTLLFWRIGQRIHTEVLVGQRAGDGEEILPTLAAQLVRDYGRSFADKNLRRMVQFAAYPDEAIVVTLSRQLSWSHFVALLPLKDPLQRQSYMQMASAERWSVRTLRGRIDSMLYERTALSKKPGDMIAQELATMRDAQHMTPALVMRDPYILDFLGPRDTWQESDLEAAAGGGGIEGRRVQGSLQRADGALPSLAGQTRAGAGGSLAAGDHPLHRKKARADRISGIGQVGNPYPSSAKRASSAPAGSTSI